MKAVKYLVIAVPILTAIPFVVAWLMAGPNHVFGGVLYANFDEYTYLAKMYQGWEGHWRFVLPYTAEPGQGAYIFLFYLFLGHVARWVNLPLALVFHLARSINSAILLFALAHFFMKIFQDEQKAWNAVLLAVCGSGLGWIALLFGGYTSDFWVAEAYPLLSSLYNPHFPLSLAIMLFLLSEIDETLKLKTGLMTFGLGVLLATISPFGVAIVGLVWGVKAGWDWLDTKDLKWQKLACFSAGGCTMLAYMVWVIYTDPVLSGWNKQNVTPSPPFYDFLVSLSPALLLAVVGIYGLIKRKIPYGRTLLIWIALVCVLLNIPFGLQRRFIVGFFVPVAGMAVIGLDTILLFNQKLYKWFNFVLIPLTLPTLVIIFILPFIGIFGLNSWFYQTNQESQAFNWIAANTRGDAVILVAPDTGLILPALTGRRVIYGHPFETVNADQEKKHVTDYFSAVQTAQQEDDYLRKSHVAYVFYGPREAALGKPGDLNRYPIVFQSGNVAVYAINP